MGVVHVDLGFVGIMHVNMNSFVKFTSAAAADNDNETQMVVISIASDVCRIIQYQPSRVSESIGSIVKMLRLFARHCSFDE